MLCIVKVFSPDLDRQELTPAASALATATRDVISFCRISSTACSSNPPISDKFKGFGHKTAMATKSALDGLKSGEAPSPQVYTQLEAAFADLLKLSSSKVSLKSVISLTWLVKICALSPNAY